jgi:hypothetical protein
MLGVQQSMHRCACLFAAGAEGNRLISGPHPELPWCRIHAGRCAAEPADEVRSEQQTRRVAKTLCAATLVVDALACNHAAQAAESAYAV